MTSTREPLTYIWVTPLPRDSLNHPRPAQELKTLNFGCSLTQSKQAVYYVLKMSAVDKALAD
jgi:hypothetical protein